MSTGLNRQTPLRLGPEVKLDDVEAENRRWSAGIGSQVPWFKKPQEEEKRSIVFKSKENPVRPIDI